MRTLAMVIGGLLAIGVSTMSKAAEPLVWQGEDFHTVVSNTCTLDVITAVGDFDRIVYRPNIPGSADNTFPDGLALVDTRSAVLLAATKTTLHGKANATEIALGSHADVSQDATTVDLKFKPAKITASTQVIEITGTINNLFNVPGCDITINAALIPRPID
jgi:hypothetical protein